MSVRVQISLCVSGLTGHVVDADRLLEVLEVGHHLGEEGSFLHPDHRQLLLDVGLGAERRKESYCS